MTTIKTTTKINHAEENDRQRPDFYNITIEPFTKCTGVADKYKHMLDVQFEVDGVGLEIESYEVTASGYRTLFSKSYPNQEHREVASVDQELDLEALRRVSTKRGGTIRITFSSQFRKPAGSTNGLFKPTPREVEVELPPLPGGGFGPTDPQDDE